MAYLNITDITAKGRDNKSFILFIIIIFYQKSYLD